MKTKYFVRFLNRLAHFDADLELVDVLSDASKKGILSKVHQNKLFDNVVPDKHPRLISRTVNDHNRSLAFAHLKTTIYSAYIKELYEAVSCYMTELICGVAKAGLSTDRLVGEHKVTFEINDILKCGNWDAMINFVSWGCGQNLGLFFKRREDVHVLKREKNESS